MDTIERILEPVPLPRIRKIRQQFCGDEVQDVPGELLRQIGQSAGYRALRPGQRIAITAGSRTFSCMQEITKTVVDAVKAAGAVPFLVPAMGSHGGATAQGQKELLAGIGVTEESMGCEILSSMEVDELGTILNGRPVFLDRNANAADGIILINRIKAHTSINGKYESGLMKMMAIGLGKQKGASHYHQTGVEIMPEVFEAAGKMVLAQKNVVFGVGVIENGYGHVGELHVLEAGDIPDAEPELLLRAKAAMPRMFCRDMDVLCVQRIGKDLSGIGADPFVTGRYYAGKHDADVHVTRLVFLDLTENSHGNANGVGSADIISARLRDKAVMEPVYANVITSNSVPLARIPMTMRTDRLALQAAIATSLLLDPATVRLALVDSTKYLSTAYISESLTEEAAAAGVEILSEPFDIPFDAEGNLTLSYD